MLFSKTDEAHFGSYHHETLVVEVNVPSEELLDMDGLKKVASLKADPETLVDMALKQTAYLHEMRHFYDCFGTMAGYSLFVSRMDLLGRFVRLATHLRTSGQRWQLPLFKWVNGNDSPEPVRSFARRAAGLRLAVDQFVAALKPFTIPGHRKETIIEVPYELGGTIQAFPYSMVRGTSLDALERFTVLYPIGFETLVEGNAQSIQRTLVENTFPSGIAERILNPIALRKGGRFTSEELAGIPMSYNVTDFLISKYLRRHGIESFPRDLVLKLSDMTLSRGTVNAGSDTISIDRLGDILSRQLSAFAPQDLASNNAPYSEEYANAYRVLLEQLERTPTLDQIPDDERPETSIEVIKLFVIHSIVFPLLQERLQTEHRAFSTFKGFQRLLQKFPRPPFLATTKGMEVKNDVPLRVFQSWGHVVMLGQLLRQIVSDVSVLVCPRARELVPGIRWQNLAFERDCRDWIEEQCGAWYDDRSLPLPNCMFSNVLRIIGLA